MTDKIDPILNAAAEVVLETIGIYINKDNTLKALEGLVSQGWSIVPPKDFPGLCSRCRTIIEPGTVHVPFNGNQMFACTTLGSNVTVEQDCKVTFS